MEKFDQDYGMVSRIYILIHLNVIHYMHDKYAMKVLKWHLHDTDILRPMAFWYCWIISCC